MTAFAISGRSADDQGAAGQDTTMSDLQVLPSIAVFTTALLALTAWASPAAASPSPNRPTCRWKLQPFSASSCSLQPWRRSSFSRDATANVVSAGASEHWNENHGAAYAVKIAPFLSPLGLPCQAPPWGAIAGVDLRTGQRAWMHRHGTVRDQMPSLLPIPFAVGVASLGGPLITAGAVVFYCGTRDNYLRAYDVTTGRKLWQSWLPAGGQATPMTYRIHGKQFVVVAAGGHGSFGTTLGDSLVAYALE